MQDLIMDLVKKLFNTGIWSRKTKAYAIAVVNKCSAINLDDESTSIKPLE